MAQKKERCVQAFKIGDVVCHSGSYTNPGRIVGIAKMDHEHPENSLYRILWLKSELGKRVSFVKSSDLLDFGTFVQEAKRKLDEHMTNYRNTLWLREE